MLRAKHIYIFFIVLAFLTGKAQKDAQYVYEGNKFYHSGKSVESVDQYRKAIKENPMNSKAHFNLGNSLYKSGLEIKKSKENFVQAGKKVTPDSLAALVFEEAAQSFAQVANSVSDKDTLHRTWHNIGNCYLQKKDFEQAVEAYKKALKLDPKDEETRYNLAYALKNIQKKNNGGGGGQQNKENKDNKDQKKNQPKNEMNKDQAEQMLKALMQAEKKLQDKRKQKQEDAGKTTVDKDW
jgi:tetratricopeptide (TPR) repeat protein